jgi:hypothetical protein
MDNLNVAKNSADVKKFRDSWGEGKNGIFQPRGSLFSGYFNPGRCGAAAKIFHGT